MHIDWISIAIGGAIGFVSGVGASYLGNWLFAKRTKRRKGQYYFTVTCESGIMHFEGQTPIDISVDQIVKGLFGVEESGNPID
jgi:hypothetical protein